MGGRTRIVKWLRVILPLAALALLSMLFLLARKPDADSTIPYAEGQLEELARAQGITTPTYSTVTEDGATVTFRASRVVPGDSGGTATNASLDWTTREGTKAQMTSLSAEQDGQTILLKGDVDMAISTGWTLTSPRIEADTAQSWLTGQGPVHATAPFGQVDAGGMMLSDTKDAGEVLELNHGVRLIYRP